MSIEEISSRLDTVTVAWTHGPARPTLPGSKKLTCNVYGLQAEVPAGVAEFVTQAPDDIRFLLHEVARQAAIIAELVDLGEDLDRGTAALDPSTVLPVTDAIAGIIAAHTTCWCGGEVGPREPGDAVGLGCLDDLYHHWRNE